MNASEVARFWEANADTWARHVRAGYDIYRDGLNTPAFLAMLPPVDGLAGLDIGCGEGENTRQLARLGAHMHAIDIAPTFIGYAQQTEAANPLGIVFSVGDGTALPFSDASFDFVTAFMSMMDMPYHDRALHEAARVLRPGGFLQFSILHPCFAPPHRKVLREPDGTVRAIEVARYFDCVDGEVETWSFSSAPHAVREDSTPFQVPRFHRTLSSWVDILVQSGLAIEKIVEPSVSDDQLRQFPDLADTRVAPLSLIVRVRKPAI